PNVAFTSDGGKTWRLGDTTGATGYLSAVAYLAEAKPNLVIAVGLAGTFLSRDSGMSWTRLDATPYNSVATATSRKATIAIVAAGDRGRVAVWSSVAAATDSSTQRLERQPPKSR